MSEKNSNPVAMFASRPRHVAFETQNPREEIELLLRQHIVTNFSWFFAVVVMLVVPFAILPLLEYVTIWQFLPEIYQFALIVLWYLLVFGFFFKQIFKWYFNVFLVTNTRVLDVDLVGFLYRNVAEAQLTQIQDVSHRQGGLFGIIFDYGSVFVQTAATRQELELTKVPHPGRVHDLITDLIAEMRP